MDKADRIRIGAVNYSSFTREPESVLVRGDTVVVLRREAVVPKGDSPEPARSVVEGIKVNVPAPTKFLAGDVKHCDSAEPVPL